MRAIIRWMLGIPNTKPVEHGLRFDERLMLIELKAEISEVTATIKTLAVDIEAMKAQLEARYDTLDDSLADLSREIFEIRNPSPIDDGVYPLGPE